MFTAVTFTVTIPNIVLIIAAACVVPLLISNFLLMPVWRRLSARTGDSVSTGPYAIPYMILNGPLTWIYVAFDYKNVIADIRRGRERRKLIAERASQENAQAT